MQAGQHRSQPSSPRPRAVRAPKGAVPLISSKGIGNPSGFFGFAEDDLSKLTEAEFGEVWAALGKLAHAKFRDRSQAPVADNENDGDIAEGEA